VSNSGGAGSGHQGDTSRPGGGKPGGGNQPVARVDLSLNLQLEFLQGAIAAQPADTTIPPIADDESDSTNCDNGSPYCEPEPDC
jgi:hypothetical protein